MKETEVFPTTLGGSFKLPFTDVELAGRLTLDGEASFLEVAGKGRERLWHGLDFIPGELTDHKAVSLVNCLILESASGGFPDGRETFRMKFFPHYVIRGDVHLRPDEPTIRSIRYEFAGARTLFRKTKNIGWLLLDYEEFNSFIERHRDKHQIGDVKAENPDGWPTVKYFSGNTEIARFATGWGSVQVNQAPWKDDVAVWMQIEFSEGQKLDDAMDHLFDVHQWMELLLGQRQPFALIKLNVGTDEQAGRKNLDLYGTMHARRTRALDRDRKPQSFDVLIDGVLDRNQFEAVGAKWLERQAELKDARVRFGSAFYSDMYSHDRLIGAANAFDILPDAYSPKADELSESEAAVVAASRKEFRKLPAGPIRTRALEALGRLGKANLATKIKHRAEIISKVKPAKFAELGFVCQQAAKCRNYYVHGGEPAFDYQSAHDAYHFLMDTLEFTFAASDLIECGWNFEEFCARGSSMTHPFGAYVINFSRGVEILKAELAKPASGKTQE